MVSETDSIIKHSARCAWRISQGIIANCICVNCRFCHFVGLQKPTKTTIPTKPTFHRSCVRWWFSDYPCHMFRHSRIFREQYSSNSLSILWYYYVITMILLCYSKHFIIPSESPWWITSTTQKGRAWCSSWQSCSRRFRRVSSRHLYPLPRMSWRYPRVPASVMLCGCTLRFRPREIPASNLSGAFYKLKWRLFRHLFAYLLKIP